jgi:hypothetical protein
MDMNNNPKDLSHAPDCEDCGDSGMVFVYSKTTGEREDFCVCEEGHDMARLDAEMNREYQAGVARGNLHSAERKLYGSALADDFAMQDEMNDYNWGL